MKNVYGSILLFAVVISAAAQQTAAPQKDKSSAEVWTVIRAGSLIDGKSDKARRDQVIVIRGNRIECVSDATNARVPAGANVIDLSKSTVLPGLIDSHTHIFLQGEDPAQGAAPIVRDDCRLSQPERGDQLLDFWPGPRRQRVGEGIEGGGFLR